jgi:hypothetical protein
LSKRVSLYEMSPRNGSRIHFSLSFARDRGSFIERSGSGFFVDELLDVDVNMIRSSVSKAWRERGMDTRRCTMEWNAANL